MPTVHFSIALFRGKTLNDGTHPIVANFVDHFVPMATLEAQLKPNSAGQMILINAHRVPYGVIEVRNDDLLFYTVKGLRRLWQPATPEEELRAPLLTAKAKAEHWDELKMSGHVDEIPLSRIASVSAP